MAIKHFPTTHMPSRSIMQVIQVIQYNIRHLRIDTNQHIVIEDRFEGPAEAMNCPMFCDLEGTRLIPIYTIHDISLRHEEITRIADCQFKHTTQE